MSDEKIDYFIFAVGLVTGGFAWELIQKGLGL